MKRLIQFSLFVISFLFLLVACAPGHPPRTPSAPPGPTASPVIGAEAIAWLKSNAIPFKTTKPGSGYDDLQPLGKIIGNARIVGLGQGSHGAHEFQQFNNRLLEFLLEEMGFNIWSGHTPFAGSPISPSVGLTGPILPVSRQSSM